MTNRGQAISVLIVSTLAFTVCFMVWMMFGVIGIPIKKILGLNATEFGLLTATPVLTGSLIRVPLGIWTDKYGVRAAVERIAGLARGIFPAAPNAGAGETECAWRGRIAAFFPRGVCHGARGQGCAGHVPFR